jgi:zinc protease
VTPRSLFTRTSLLTVLAAAFLCAATSNAPAARTSRSAPARTTPAGPQRVASVEGITEFRLANGLRVLLFPDPSQQTITVNVTYMVGSASEGYGETGMAHLLEHLMFKGSTHHPNVPQELTAHGARPNGTTWYDRTNYFETFAANDANLTWALELEADRMVHSFIAQKDLASEMTVVRNEFELGENSPENILSERVWSTAFLWHNYAHPTIGARSDIENVPIDRLQAFYRKYYQPDNAILAVAGKIDEAKTLALIARTFGSLPRPARTLPALYTAEPTQDGERMVTLRRVGDVQVAQVGYHIPAGSHADFAALDLLAFLLGDEPSGRLYKALVEPKKATSVHAEAWQFHYPSLFTATAVLQKTGDLSAAEAVLTQTVEAAGTTSVSGEDVERARQARLKDWELTLRNSERACIALSEWSGMGDWRLMFLYRDALKKVTPADVQHVAAAYLKPSNRTTGLFIPTDKPDRADIPPVPDVASMVRDYKGGVAIAQGEAFDPSPANIESHVTRSKLASGSTLVLLPKKTRGEAVHASLTFHFGDVTSLKGRRVAAGLAADMLLRGTTEHTRQQLKDELDRLKARVDVDGDAEHVTVDVETTRENLPAVMRLVGEILRHPAFPASEFEQLRQEKITEQEQARSEPFALGQIAFRRHLQTYGKDHPRYTATPEEQLEALRAATLDQVKAFYADFYGASAGEIAIVGDFDAAATKQLASDLFGDWRSKTAFVRITSPYTQIAATSENIETPDKESAIFMAGERIRLRDTEADYPALVLGNFMTGGGFLNSRLTTRIRQKEGLSYGVGSFFVANHWDDNAVFGAYAIYAPQNAARLEAAFKDEMTQTLAKGFTETELAEAKKGWMQYNEVSRSKDDELASRLATLASEERTMAWVAELEKKVAALTADQVHEAMVRHVDMAQMTIVKAGDFAGAAKSGTPGKQTGTPSGKE